MTEVSRTWTSKNFAYRRHSDPAKGGQKHDIGVKKASIGRGMNNRNGCYNINSGMHIGEYNFRPVNNFPSEVSGYAGKVIIVNKDIASGIYNLKNCDYSIRIGENLGIVQILGADSSKRVLDAIGIKSGIAKKEASLDHGIVEIRDISSRLII